MKEKRTIVPRRRAERAVTLAAALAVLLGGLTAAAAWREKASPAAPPDITPACTAVPGTLSGLKILVDPGHGGYDGGARCRDSGLWEKQLNLAVGLQLEQALTRQGAEVIMTRREDIDLCEAERPAALTKKRQDMQNRIALAQENQVDMVLSVHMNEYRVRSESGPQVFYRAGCDGGRLLAGCIQEAMISALRPRRERSAMAGDYFILQLAVPSVLIECGFISNPEEEKLLLTEDYQARLAETVTAGVVEFLQLGQ